ncbi:kinase-like domain-containing protein [Kalaharituber pfeilii]|nr:kinase-like domain-containing protein [Kalaharituber pfeilii]
MAAANRSRAELQKQRAKLVNSYNELLTEFSSNELRTVGNYTLGKLVGKGSFGRVYLATHKLTNGSKVVLKSAQKTDANLAREIHHHRQLIHPHIARLYEVIVTESLVWLVLEYCPGNELYNYLINNGRLSVDKTRKIFAQLCGAVAYVHQKSCVHRDLKLENILLDKHENVKLCDFGFTREYEKQKLLQTFCGTVCYSAPEMLKGEKYVAQAVDVWSLGVILYALLRGELPFDEDDEAETKRKILGEEPKYPEDLPKDAIPLLKSLLNKKPSLRPTLDELLAHPFLAEWGPPQQDILAIKPAPAFSTKLERDTLLRLKSAGVNIDQVMENVLAQRCDSLAGWWNLLIEKEQKKEVRKQRKRIESRRISVASNLDPMMLPPPIPEGDHHQNNNIDNPLMILPGLVMAASPRPITPPSPAPPPPIEKDYSPYLKPPQHPERQIMSSPDLTAGPGLHVQRRTRKQVIIAQLASLKHWFLDSAKRATSPSTKAPSNVQTSSQKSHTSRPETRSQGKDSKSKHGDKGQSSSEANGRPDPGFNLNTQTRSTPPPKRNSLSPSPMTPHSSYRRSSGRGLGGRNSTSSSVSSIRSFHNKSHSKASSTSSASITSIKTPRSPRNTLKIHHPSTPTSGLFPNSLRLTRGGYNEGAIFNATPQYAKRRRTPLKGPLLLAPPSASGPSSEHNVFGGRLGLGGRKRDLSMSRNSDQGKAGGGGGIIEEEEEEMETEVVMEFGPLGPNEQIVGIEQDEDDGDEEYDDGDSDTLRGRNSN